MAAHLDGFDLHADIRVPPNDRARQEYLCRLSLPFNHPVLPEEPRAVGGQTHRFVAKDL